MIIDTMDDGKGKSAEIDKWMKELLPDGGDGMWQPSVHNSGGRPNTYQLPMDSKLYLRNLSQHQQASSGSMPVNQQDPFNVLQQSGQANMLEPQCGIVNPEHANPRMQMPAFHHSPHHMLLDQRNLQMTQPMLYRPIQGSSDSTSQVDLTNSIDWITEAHNKIISIREKHQTDIIMYRNRVQEVKRRAPSVEAATKAEKARIFAEKVVHFLNMTRTDLLQMGKEKVFQNLEYVVKQFQQQFRSTNSSFQARQAQPVEASFNHLSSQHQNHQPPQTLQYPSFRQGGALAMPQTSFNSFKVGSSVGVHKVDGSSMVNNASLYNPMRSTQQWPPQGGMVASPQMPYKASQPVFDQRALRLMLLHPSGVSQHNNSLCTSQQSVASPRNIFNSLDHSMSQPPVSMPLQNNQQDQAMKRQKMKQPVQQMMTEKNKQQQKWNDDSKMRRLMGQNQRWSPVLPPPSSSPYAISPQNSQHSSSQLDVKDLSSMFTKSTTPSLSASPSALPSPLTPSSNPADSVRSPLNEEIIKSVKTCASPLQLPLQDKNQGHISTDTQRLTKSCLNREYTRSGDKQSSDDIGGEVERLVDAVKSMSSGALNAAVKDMYAVTCLIDRVHQHPLDGDPTKINCDDLADEINGCLEHSSLSRMKRKLDAVVLNDLITETKSDADGRIKRQKEEKKELLLDEIKEINKRLIEVMVDVITPEDVSIEGFGDTLVRCSYIPIGTSRNTNTRNITKLTFPNLLLDLTVSADYPDSSPTVQEKIPSDFRFGEEGKSLWMKAMSRFSLSLRKLSQPISVRQMAETWDVCAREVFHEYAGQFGELNFSSTYGKWENCAVAG